MGDPFSEANQLWNIGFLYVKQGETSKAKENLEAAYKRYMRLGASPKDAQKVKHALDTLEARKEEES